MTFRLHTLVLGASIFAASGLFADTREQSSPAAPPDGPPPPVLALGAEHIGTLAAPGDVLTRHTFDTGAQDWTKFFDCTTAVTWDPAGQLIKSGKECLDVPPPPPPYCAIYWHWNAPGAFIAPARVDGAAYGGTLSYDLSMTTDVGDVGTNGLDVAIRGFAPGGGTQWIATSGVVNSLHTTTVNYSVQLDESRSWILWDGTDAPASPEMVKSVIGSMFMLHLRGSYKLACEQGNGSSLDNVQIVAGGAAPGDPLAVSTTTLPVRSDSGWYLNNPFTVTVTLENSGIADIPGDFVLQLFSDDGKARFYVYESDLQDDTPGVTIEREFHGLHSLRSFKVTRAGTSIAPGQTQVLAFKLWGQPSEAALLRAKLTWRGADHFEAVAVDQASIHPVVFLHGIQGSQPPQFRLLRDRETAQDLLDPFTNGYVPLLDNLVKMGYEWDRTLFAFAYNWMRSNDRSARELAWRLPVLVLPRAAEVPWSAFYQDPSSGKVDLIGHSNGGLVSRAYVQGDGYAWNVRKLITLGTPHRGFVFDYKTWEHGEWEDYMQHADAVLPGAPLLFEKASEYLLWPALVARRYRPDPDLYDEFTGPPFNPFRRFIYYTGNDYRLVPFNDLYDFMHDEGRGVHSLRELLPVDGLGAEASDGRKAYLLSLRGGAFPFGHERNFWLERLNANIGRLEARLGLDNIYAVYGAGVDTPLAYRVLTRGRHGWRFGEPLPFLTITGPGDNLILEESASLDGLLSLGAANKGRLDEATYGSLGPVTHTPLVYHPYTQQGLIPLYLTGAGLPFHTPWEAPDICASGRKLVRSTLGPRWQQITEFVLGRVVPEIDPTGFCPGGR